MGKKKNSTNNVEAVEETVKEPVITEPVFDAPELEPVAKPVVEKKVKEKKEKKPSDENFFVTACKKTKSGSVKAFQFCKKWWGKNKRYFDARNKKNIYTVIGRIIVYVLLVVLGYIFLSPIIDMFCKSFMPTDDIINPSVFYIPLSPTFGNYTYAMELMGYTDALWNSIWISALLAAIEMLVCALTAYAIARYDFYGKKVIIALIIVSFIIPAIVILAPRVDVFVSIENFFKFGQQTTNLKMINTIIPGLLMAICGQGVFSSILVLIFYNFFKQIPYDLDEAAYIDGANSWQVFYHVILKLSLPIIFTVFLFAFIWNWNDTTTLTTLTATSGSGFQTLPTKIGALSNAGTGNLSTGTINLNEGIESAGTLLAILPLIILYMLVQRRFIEGIEQTGITGV